MAAIEKDFRVKNGIVVAENATIGGNLNVLGDLNVSGAQVLSGNITLGDESTDTLTINTLNVSAPNNLNFDSNTLFIDSTNNRIGIGTDLPQVPMQLAYTAGVPDASLITSDAFIITAEQTPPGFAFVVASDTSSGHRGVFKATRSRGTLAAPTAPNNNDSVFSLLGAVYDGATVRATAAIDMTVDGAVSSGVAPQRITFLTGDSSSRIERMRITSAGNVGIGTSTPTEKLDVNGNANISGNVTLTGELRGPAVFKIDPAGIGDNTGKVVIAGDLQVDGTTTTINSTTLTISDKQIVLASGAVDAAAADGAGILIDGANATLTYDGTNDQFQFNKEVYVNGRIGIGTDDPQGSLHIRRQDTVSGLETHVDFILENPGLGNARFFLKTQANNRNWEFFADDSDGAFGIYDGVGAARRMTILPDGNVGFGISNPTANVHIAANTNNDALRVTQTGSGNALVVEDSTSPDATPFVIDASGNVVVGYTQTINNWGGVPSRFAVHGATTSQTIQDFSWSNTANFGGSVEFNRSRGGSAGNQTIVQNGDRLGEIRFRGSDGSNFITSALIQAEVDGTPGTNDMPGRLVFSTTADGASSPTERVRITSNGNVGIGTSLPTATLDIVGNTPSTNTAQFGSFGVQSFNDSNGFLSVNGYWNGTEWIYRKNGFSSLIQFDTGNILLRTLPSGTAGQIGSISTRLVVKNNGNVGIGTDNPSQLLDLASGDPRINITDTDAGGIFQIRNTSGAGYVSTLGSHPLIFGTSSAERLRIDSSGNVGIGTSSPSGILHIGSNISFVGSGRNLIIANSGSHCNVVIASGPAHVADLQFRQTGDTSNKGIVRYDISNNMRFFTNGSEHMRIASTGNVGIGTTTPDTFGKLAVAGNIVPAGDALHDLGTPTYRWNNVYTTDLHLSNESKPEGNSVDGTTGNWTIQEGADHLYIINNKTNKKYKFALEEIE